MPWFVAIRYSNRMQKGQIYGENSYDSRQCSVQVHRKDLCDVVFDQMIKRYNLSLPVQCLI